MKLLLVVGTANDVFVYNMAKWLKACMEDISIDVFEFNHSRSQGYTNDYFDNVYTIDTGLLLNKVKGIRSLLLPYWYNYQFNNCLKNKYYDIIHCHWLIPNVIVSRNLKLHCKKLFVTFWGGELEYLKIIFSHKIYLWYLRRFLKKVDYIVNSQSFCEKNEGRSLFLYCKFKYANLGSVPLEKLYNLIDLESKAQSKKKLGINIDKKTVLIGYSGKSIHQHIPIIKTFSSVGMKKEFIHFLVPMTRGASSKYVQSVENMLQQSGYTYTLIKNCYLTDMDVARLRNATDITLQLSLFDGFSRSIIECLCARSILIYGNWLNYSDRLKEEGFSGITVQSIEEGVEKVYDIVDDLENYQTMGGENSQNGKNKNLWSECIMDWVTIYKANS